MNDIRRRKAKIERQKQLQNQREAEKTAKAAKAAELLAKKTAKPAKGKPALQDGSYEQGSGTGSDVSLDEEEEAGFHTASEGDDLDLDADLDEEEASEGSGDDEDDEEMLDMKNDPKMQRLHARMQKAMEAAERKALLDDSKPSTSKSTKESKPAEVSESTVEHSEYDMGPLPLPQSVLRVAAEVDLMRKKAEKRKAEAANTTKNKKRRRRMQREEEDISTRSLK